MASTFFDNHFVYEITNRRTGKSYVGQSKSATGRWHFHLNDAFVVLKSNQLYQDMRELGPEGFDFRILDVCADDEGARDREKFRIAERVNDGRPVYNVLLTERLGYGAHGEENPYVRCACRFGHSCRKKRISRTPTARAHRVTPQVFDAITRLRQLDVSLKKIAAALDLSVGTVHRYAGSARKPSSLGS